MVITSIKKAWRGEEKLWIVYWVYAIPATLLTLILFSLFPRFIAMPLTIILMSWLYLVDWRCAFNANWRGWGYIVRFLTVLGFINLIHLAWLLITRPETFGGG